MTLYRDGILPSNIPGNLKRYPVESYIPDEKAARLLHISKKTLLTQASTSDSLHGLMLQDGTVLYHPDGFIQRLIKTTKRDIKKLLIENGIQI